MDNIAGQPSDAERKPTRKIEYSANCREQRGSNKERTTEFPLRRH
jgi:hypothetical protein